MDLRSTLKPTQYNSKQQVIERLLPFERDQQANRPCSHKTNAIMKLLIFFYFIIKILEIKREKKKTSLKDSKPFYFIISLNH